MREVVFTGAPGSLTDARELSAPDLKKVGVEGFSKTTFRRGEVVEVEDDVADALVNNDEYFGDFAYHDADARTTVAPNNSEVDPTAVAGEPGASGSEGSGSTGRGKSTGGAGASTPGTTGGVTSRGSTSTPA